MPHRDPISSPLSSILRRATVLGAMLALGSVSLPARANNYGESLAWQFRTSADRVNQAAILDLIAKHRGGYYAAPVYNTRIDRQFNCAVTATATGNNGAQSALANSPSVTGANATATGNDNDASVGGGRSPVAIDGTLSNSGPVVSGISGATGASAAGDPRQALNSTQSNSGDQSAAVSGSNACAFGALN